MKRLSFLIPFLFWSCGTNIPYEQEDLTPPSVFSVTALANGKMQIDYAVTNDESHFDGYNLYIAKETISDAAMASMEPLVITGSLPTFIHTPEEYNPSIQLSEVIETQDGFLPFSAGTQYFFRLAAHGINGRTSQGSSVLSATAQ